MLKPVVCVEICTKSLVFTSENWAIIASPFVKSTILNSGVGIGEPNILVLYVTCILARPPTKLDPGQISSVMVVNREDVISTASAELNVALMILSEILLPPNKVTASNVNISVSTMSDPEIFEHLEYDYETLHKRLKELAYLNKGVKITIEDKRSNKKDQFQFQGGIKEFVTELNKGKNAVHDVLWPASCHLLVQPVGLFFPWKKSGKHLVSG